MTARVRFIGLVLLLTGFPAAGCAVVDTGAFERLQNEMAGVKRDMAALKAAQPPVAAAPSAADGGEVQSLRKGYADLSNDFDRVRSDLLVVTSRMDEARLEMQRITSRQNEIDRALQETRGNAGRGGRELEARVTALEEKVGKLSAVPAPSAAAPSVATPPPAWKGPEEMYDYAIGQVKGGNPKAGRETLSAFVSKYPDHKLVPNALYWKGEAFYAEKDYENAILSFQDVVDRFPSGDKAPDAMYKQGVSFLALNDKKNAKVLLELVVSKYPKSNAAEMAKRKLSEIH